MDDTKKARPHKRMRLTFNLDDETQAYVYAELTKIRANMRSAKIIEAYLFYVDSDARDRSLLQAMEATMVRVLERVRISPLAVSVGESEVEAPTKIEQVDMTDGPLQQGAMEFLASLNP